MHQRALSLLLTVFCLLVSLLLVSCSTLMAPGDGEGTVSIMVGGFVQTIDFGDGQTLNLQITAKPVPIGQALFPHMLTIGKFSRIAGSGFAARSNIYYEKRINRAGKDTFKVGDTSYHVVWQLEGRRITAHSGFYGVTIKRTEKETTDTPQ